VQAAIHEQLFDPDRGIYVDGVGTEHASLHANLFPLVFGIVPSKNRKTVIEFVKSRGMACSVYGAHYLIEALFDAGEDQAAIDLLTSQSDRSWVNMLRVGSTVTTEAWDVKYKANAGWTHAWSASPAHLLPRKLLGVEPLEPGFGKVLIRPRPGKLTHATATLPTIRGPIRVSFDQHPGKSFQLKFNLPANVTGCVVLEATSDAEMDVIVDGHRQRGTRVDGGIMIESLGSGSHTLERIDLH
jgi:hypothetical protein